MTALLDLPAITTETTECIGCLRETETSSKLRAFYNWKPAGCPLHQLAPAHSVANRLRATFGDTVRITVSAHGGVTVEYVAAGQTLDAIEQQWDWLADACGIPQRWQRHLVSSQDTQVKARVRHGYVDPGMPCEYRRGVPVRLVAHGWAAAYRLAA